jgi:tryptophan-rich sensory protein
MSRKTTRKNTIGFFAWLALVIVAAALGGLANANAGNFYSQLDQPEWAPPGWLFGPVWSLLYLMMSVAAWLVWKTHGFRGARMALSLFLIQLALNSLWSWLFFAWQLGALSVAEIVVLWLLAPATIGRRTADSLPRVGDLCDGVGVCDVGTQSRFTWVSPRIVGC